MTDLVEAVAFALWKEDAVRAAPNTARYRTPFAFQGQSEPLKDKWRGLARAALRAVADVLDGDSVCRRCGTDREGWLKCDHIICPGGEVFGQRFEPPPALRASGKCRKCGGDMVEGIAMGQTYTTGTPDFPGDAEGSTMSPGGPGMVIPARKCIACGWSVT